MRNSSDALPPSCQRQGPASPRPLPTPLQWPVSDRDQRWRRRLARLLVVFAVLSVFLSVPTARAVAARQDQAASSASADAPRRLNMTALGQVGGQVSAVAVQGTLAYIGIGPRLAVLDVAHPATPTLIGMTAPLSGLVEHITLAGPEAYVVCVIEWKHVLDIVRIADARHPARLSTYTAPQPITTVLLDGSIAYVGTAGAGIHLLDVTDPAAPVDAGTFGPATGSPISVAHNQLYAVNADSVAVFDVAEPAQPRLVTTNRLAANIPVGLVGTRYAYGLWVAPRAGAFTVSDLAAPGGPSIVGSVQTGEAAAFAVASAYAYVVQTSAITGQQSHLQVITLADPRHPAPVASVTLPGDGRQVVVAGHAAYVTDGLGLRVIDITDPAHPILSSSYEPAWTGAALGVAVQGHDAYVASGLSLYGTPGQSGLRIFDVANPAAPRLLGRWDALGPAWDWGGRASIAVRGQYVYVAGPGGFFAVDVADPVHPTGVVVSKAAAYSGLALAGQDAYLSGTGGLHVFDLSNPAAPKPIGGGALPTFSSGIAVQGGYAYVTATPDSVQGHEVPGGLHIFAITDPARPVEVGVADTAFAELFGVAVLGPDAFVGSSDGGQIFDVTDPRHPRAIPLLDAPQLGSSIALVGNQAYTESYGTVHLLSLADPGNPSEVGEYELPDAIQSIAAANANANAYVADGSDGLWIVRQSATAAPSGIPHDTYYYGETGFRLDDPVIRDYFLHRGGANLLGYPTSRVFPFLGHPTQFFQRVVLQRFPDGSVRPLNLLDPGFLPYRSFNFSVVPAPDLALARKAPPPGSPGYAQTILSFVRQQAPDTWNGLPVHFFTAFAGGISLSMAYPSGDGNPGLVPLLNLELWGVPTSAPAFDPANHRFVYQRFQRGVLMYNAACSCTHALLLADDLKAILTGDRLPADLAQEAANSPFLDQYDPGAPTWERDPSRLPNTNLTNAFTPE